MAVVELTGAGADVIAHPEGWALVFCDGFDVTCLVNGVVRWTYTIVPGVTIDNPPLFPRIACDDLGNVKMVCSMTHVDNVDYAYLIEEGAQTDLGIVVQTQRGVLIEYVGGDFIVYVMDSPTTYISYPQAGAPSAPINTPFAPEPNPLGFLDVVESVITWACNDSATSYRTVELGGVVFFLPNERGGVTVGQAVGLPASPEGIIAYHRAGVSTVIPGKGFDPHLAQITAGPDSGSYIFVASMLNNIVAYAVVAVSAWPAFQGTILSATIPPVETSVSEKTDRGERMSRPWQGWAQSIRRAVLNAGEQINGLQQAIVAAFAFIAVDGQNTVSADAPGATLNLTSDDGSVTITTNTLLKKVDFSAASAAVLDAQFIVAAAHAGLSAERVATNNVYTSWDFTVAAQAAVNLAGPLPVLTADPASPTDMTAWLFASATTVPVTVSLRIRIAGVTYDNPLFTIV